MLKYTNDPDTTKFEEAKEKYLNVHMKRFLQAIQNKIDGKGHRGTQKKYLVGDSLTIADIESVNTAYTYILNEANIFYDISSKFVRENYPKVVKYFEYHHDNELKDYFQTRP